MVTLSPKMGITVLTPGRSRCKRSRRRALLIKGVVWESRCNILVNIYPVLEQDSMLRPPTVRERHAVQSPRIVCINDFRPIARRRLPKAVFDYLDGGARKRSYTSGKLPGLRRPNLQAASCRLGSQL